MKLIISPVEKAIITIEKETKKEIGKGLLVYLGVSKQDCELEETELQQKISKGKLIS